jgi:hypothetical protein
VVRAAADRVFLPFPHGTEFVPQFLFMATHPEISVIK